MIIIDWYKEVVLKKYLDFSGRAGKSEFWYFVLGNFIISFVLGLIKFGDVAWLSSIYSLAVLLPSLAVSVRRLQDIGKGWPNLFFVLIPLVGIILLVVWWVKDGDPQENAYGPVPSNTPGETAGNDTTPPADNTTPTDNTVQ